MIRGSVGFGGGNDKDDVATVQRLLKTKGYDPGVVNGRSSPTVIDAIRRFQLQFLSRPDGLVEPGHRTWQRLSSTLDLGGGSSTLMQWNGDSARWPQDRKVASLTPLLRPKVQAVVTALTGRGFQPGIFYGWRSVAVQLELFKKGNSKVKFSFHNAQLLDGTPNSYAADIIDSRYAWSAQAASAGFWKALGEEAKKQDLFWGGDWSGFRDWAHVQLLDNGDLGRVKRESGL